METAHKGSLDISFILSKFSLNFKENLLTNPTYNAVYEMLLQGVNEYEIIEELLKINELQNDIIVKERQKQQLKYFLKPE
jgi:hypothetical protein